MHSTLHIQCDEHALNIYCVTGTATGPEDTMVNKTDESLPSWSLLPLLLLLLRKTINNNKKSGDGGME